MAEDRMAMLDAEREPGHDLAIVPGPPVAGVHQVVTTQRSGGT